MVDHATLRELAMAATPGPWQYFEKPKYDEHHVSLPIEGTSLRRPLFVDGCNSDRPEADAMFIAAANPATMQALLNEIEAQRDLLAKSAGDLDVLAIALDVGLTPRETLVERCRAEIAQVRAAMQSMRHAAAAMADLSIKLLERMGLAEQAQHGRLLLQELREAGAECPTIDACVTGCQGHCRELPDTDRAWPMPLACAFSDACPDGCRGTCQTAVGGDSDGGEAD